MHGRVSARTRHSRSFATASRALRPATSNDTMPADSSRERERRTRDIRRRQVANSSSSRPCVSLNPHGFCGGVIPTSASSSRGKVTVHPDRGFPRIHVARAWQLQIDYMRDTFTTTRGPTAHMGANAIAQFMSTAAVALRSWTRGLAHRGTRRDGILSACASMPVEPPDEPLTRPCLYFGYRIDRRAPTTIDAGAAGLPNGQCGWPGASSSKARRARQAGSRR